MISKEVVLKVALQDYIMKLHDDTGKLKDPEYREAVEVAEQVAQDNSIKLFNA